MTPAPIETIKRIAGLDPAREVCLNKCPIHKERRPCDCYPGISLEAAVRLVRSFEAYYIEQEVKQ